LSGNSDERSQEKLIVEENVGKRDTGITERGNKPGKKGATDRGRE